MIISSCFRFHFTEITIQSKFVVIKSFLLFHFVIDNGIHGTRDDDKLVETNNNSTKKQTRNNRIQIQIYWPHEEIAFAFISDCFIVSSVGSGEDRKSFCFSSLFTSIQNQANFTLIKQSTEIRYQTEEWIALKR